MYYDGRFLLDIYAVLGDPHLICIQCQEIFIGYARSGKRFSLSSRCIRSYNTLPIIFWLSSTHIYIICPYVSIFVICLLCYVT